MANQFKLWTADEDARLREFYPAHGAVGVIALGVLPGRSRQGILARANKLGVANGAHALDVANSETPWPMPVHDYTPADRAFQAWRGPVNRAPLRGMA